MRKYKSKNNKKQGNSNEIKNKNQKQTQIKNI